MAFSLLLAASGAALARTVYAGGQSIGVLLETEGLTVVGISPVTTDAGESVTPASDAGLMIGDLITAVDGVRVRGNGEITELLARAGSGGESCRVEYLRQGEPGVAEIDPVYCTSCDSWRIGLYVRDDAAGVGTLTFWDPESGVFGALGHDVTGVGEGGSGGPRGIVVRAVVQGVKAGAAGAPGEKLGVLREDGWQGLIDANESCGIFGRMDSLPAAGGELLETASADQVEEGPAQMLTVLEGETVESFQVNILKAGSELKEKGGLIVEVTDERLLEEAGGIIQGMSGSPLLQNGRLIGAVSHVFINDPGKGYGVYIENMLNAAEQACPEQAESSEAA
ncbi:MAG: SpoIVB peptidase [Firmicutes bacterium]|nr:SpoIVB peptidase [Bacillota bacterium]